MRIICIASGLLAIANWIARMFPASSAETSETFARIAIGDENFAGTGELELTVSPTVSQIEGSSSLNCWMSCN
jgi:hypothetical protein